MTHQKRHVQVQLACSLLASGAATEAAAATRLAGRPSAPAQAAWARRQSQKCLLTMLMVSTHTVKLHQIMPCLTAPGHTILERKNTNRNDGHVVAEASSEPSAQAALPTA